MSIVRVVLAAIFLALGAYWLGIARRWDWAVRTQPRPSTVPPLPFAFVSFFLGVLSLLLAFA